MAPRKDRTPVVIVDNATLTEELVNAATTPMVEIIGTSTPESSVPTDVVTPPTTPAGVNLADDKGLAPTPAAITVPVAPTDAQVAARIARTEGIDVAFSHFYGKRTIAAAGAFVEPDEDQIETLIDAFKAEHGVKTMAAAVAIKESIDSQRAAYNAAASDQSKVDREWLTAYRTELLSHLATIDTLITTAGGKIGKTTKTTSTDETKTREAKTVDATGKASSTWATKATKLYAWGKQHGINQIVLVDGTRGGYTSDEGQAYHAVIIHTDGRLEKADYNQDTYAVKGTGEYVTTPIYFNAPDGKRPSYSPNQMFGVLLGTKKVEGINYDGVKSHLGSLENILKLG